MTPLAPRLTPLLLVVAGLFSPVASTAENTERLVETIGPHSQGYFLLEPFHTVRVGDRSSIHHVGMLTEESNEGFRISAVLDGLPAHQAGLRRGDLLLEVDGLPFQPVHSLNPRFSDGSKAAAGTRQIRLLYQRNGEQQTAILNTVYGNLYDAFRTATLNSPQQFSSGNKVIGYLRLWSLDRTANGLQTYRQLLASLSHCDGLIIDVRNGYGFISAEHLDSFFPNRRRYFQLENAHPDLWPPRQSERMNDDYYDRAVVVIQNSGTRGGLELFSYQLAGLQRVISLGQPTAGRMGQVILRNGNVIYVPGDDLTLNGIKPESGGFAPEQQVPYPLTDSGSIDPQFEAAMMTLMQII